MIYIQQEFSSHDKHHFRHDILKWGICLNKVRQNLSEYNIKEDVQFETGSNSFNEARFKQLGKVWDEFQFQPKDEIDIQSYVRYRFTNEYGLKALSNVSFCVSKANEDLNKGERSQFFLARLYLIKIFCIRIHWIEPSLRLTPRSHYLLNTYRYYRGPLS